MEHKHLELAPLCEVGEYGFITIIYFWLSKYFSF